MWNTNEHAQNSPITDEQIASAEQKLGVSLPRSYIEALRIKNGGSIVGEFIKLPNQEIPEHLNRFIEQGFIRVYGINGIGSGTGVLGTEYLIAEWGLPDEIVILDGDGHWWIAFDYRNDSPEPPIIFIDSDSGDVLHVADDFTQFFSSTVRADDIFDEYGNLIA